MHVKSAFWHVYLKLMSTCSNIVEWKEVRTMNVYAPIWLQVTHLHAPLISGFFTVPVRPEIRSLNVLVWISAIHPMVPVFLRTSRRFPVHLRRKFHSLWASTGHVTYGFTVYDGFAGLRWASELYSWPTVGPVGVGRVGPGWCRLTRTESSAACGLSSSLFTSKWPKRPRRFVIQPTG